MRHFRTNERGTGGEPGANEARLADQLRTTRHRRAMLRAIRDAARETALFKGSSLTDGLRVIRTFERVNGLAFDPLNEYHCHLTRGWGFMEAVKRRVDRIATECDLLNVANF